LSKNKQIFEQPAVPVLAEPQVPENRSRKSDEARESTNQRTEAVIPSSDSRGGGQLSDIQKIATSQM
jgi:hypothetical protein